MRKVTRQMAGLFIHETHRFAFNLQYKIVTYKTQIISSPQLKHMKTFRFILVLSFLVLIGCERKNDQSALAEESNIKVQHGRLCKTYEVFAEQLKQDPSLQKRMDEIENFTQRYMKDPAAYRLLADGTLE